MAGSPEITSFSDITNRWPGIAEHDIDQAAAFVEYHLTEGGEQIDAILEDEQGSDSDLLYALASSASWRLSHRSDPTREEIYQAASEVLFNFDESRVVEALQSGDTEMADQSIKALFEKWPLELSIYYSPSPLFPEGREAFVPLDISDGKRPNVPMRTEFVVDCHGKKVETKKDITDYITRFRDNEITKEEIQRIQNLAEESLDYSEQEFERLRQTYGTKAATLFILDTAINTFRSKTKNMSEAADFKVPEFAAAPIELHKMYKDGDERYPETLENIRHQAIDVTADRYNPEAFRPLVVVRSSAVNSEDGENASGAGIYASIAVDPRDPDAFKKAVEQVYQSMDTEEAQAYRETIGVEEEHMGLVIQRYIEDTKDYKNTCLYGYIQSSDPLNRFVTLSSDAGELLFDRTAVEERFMIDPPFGRTQLTLHYNPDHNTLISNFNRRGALLANAALFAEKLLGKQVELEFALDDSNTVFVVQARPLPHQEKPPRISFPTDVEPLVECRAVGVGDVIVTVRDDDRNIHDERTFDWIDNENRMGDKLYLRKENKILVIRYNDAESGHIQMLARERGQICLYPNALTALPPELEDEILPDSRQSRVRKFRVVSDGYRGAIYPYDEERAVHILGLASVLSRLIASKTIEK